MKFPAYAGGWFLGALIGVQALAAVKVEEEVLVAEASTAQIVVAPRGVRVAAVIPKGSRQAVVVDGVEGPRFDKIHAASLHVFKGTGGAAEPSGTTTAQEFGSVVTGFGGGGGQPVIFSSDGKHCAYIGRAGAECAIVLNGKEIHRDAYSHINWLAFAPRSGRLVAIADSPDGGQSRVVVDGQPGPWSSNGTPQVFFTPDGAHYAYLGQQPGGQSRWMVIDGRQVKYAGDIVGFLPNGFLLTRVSANGETVLLGNGKPMTAVNSIGYLAIAPVTGRLLMQVKPPLGYPPRDKPSVITIDGQIIPGTEGASIVRSWFSPDGKRFAAVCQVYANGVETFVILDGKKGLTYANIFVDAPYKPAFSADSSKFCYVAQSANGMFVVVDEDESDPLQTIATGPLWSPTGARLVWGGTTMTRKPVFSLDGKPAPLPGKTLPGSTFRFSADSVHTTWSFGTANAFTLVVDGQPIPNVAGLGFVGTEAVDGNNTTIQLSPDGKHAAYVACDPQNPARRGVWVDGKLISPITRPQANRAAFTPDSQHVVWAIASLIQNNIGAYSVFVDGREELQYESSPLDNTPGAWEMGDDGTLTLLGIDEGALKRYRVPLSSGSGLAAMLAAAK
ncbi:MAG: hypothetical protein JNG83_10445 [Opitutaceae bacterium]|nr:hypothetical protein [Opitutaceae bacterium]